MTDFWTAFWAFSPEQLAGTPACLGPLILAFFFLIYGKTAVGQGRRFPLLAGAFFLASLHAALNLLSLIAYRSGNPIDPYLSNILGTFLQTTAAVFVLLTALYQKDSFQTLSPNNSKLFAAGTLILVNVAVLVTTHFLNYRIPIDSILWVIALLFYGISLMLMHIPNDKHQTLGFGFSLFLLGCINAVLIFKRPAFLQLLSEDSFDVILPHFWIIECLSYTLILLCFLTLNNRMFSTRLETLKRQLEMAAQKTMVIMQTAPLPIMIFQLNEETLLFANSTASQLFHIDMTTDIGRVKLRDYYTDPNTRKILLRALNTVGSVENLTILFRRRDTLEEFWVEMNACVINFNNELALYTICREITQQKRQEEALYQDATIDPLTKCYNRRQLYHMVSKEITRAWRYNRPFCLIMVDIDHFKSINDTYGHSAGDEALKALVQSLQTQLRSGDSVGRYGGEEFVIVLPEIDAKTAFPVAERLRKNISKLKILTPDKRSFSLTVSMGLVESVHSQDVNQLIQFADKALYIAKDTGRNRTVVYDGTTQQKEAPVSVVSSIDSNQE